MIFYQSYCRAMTVQASLRICADSPEPSLLKYTRQGRQSWIHFLQHMRSKDAFEHISRTVAFVVNFCHCQTATAMVE